MSAVCIFIAHLMIVFFCCYRWCWLLFMNFTLWNEYGVHSIMVIYMFSTEKSEIVDGTKKKSVDMCTSALCSSVLFLNGFYCFRWTASIYNFISIFISYILLTLHYIREWMKEWMKVYEWINEWLKCWKQFLYTNRNLRTQLEFVYCLKNAWTNNINIHIKEENKNGCVHFLLSLCLNLKH